MIFYDKVTKVYGEDGYPAVEDVTLTIEPGEFVSIVGHSGAGTSTLAGLFMQSLAQRPLSPRVSTFHWNHGKLATIIYREIT